MLLNNPISPGPAAAMATTKDTYWTYESGKMIDLGKFEKDLVFVIMGFNKRRRTYGIIKSECKELKLNPLRADELKGSGVIIREVIKSIESAEFLVCDLTDERPNVYYEIGYAHAVGNHRSNILMIAKKGSKVHFDISSLRVHYYDSLKSLRSIIKTNMADLIYKTRNLMLISSGMSLTEPGNAVANEMVENTTSLSNTNPSLTNFRVTDFTRPNLLSRFFLFLARNTKWFPFK